MQLFIFEKNWRRILFWIVCKISLFFFKIGIFPPKTLQPYKSFGKHCLQQSQCRNACCQNSVHFFILQIGDRELHFYYTDNKFTILHNGIFLFFRFFAENGSFWNLLTRLAFSSKIKDCCENPCFSSKTKL